MENSDNFAQANEYLRIALPLINKHSIPPNPMHYTVWYAYASGQNLQLTNAINNILESKGTITEETSIELYKKYLENHDAVAIKVNESVNKVMNALSDQLVNSSDQAQQYGNLLGTVDEQLDSESSMDNLQEVVKNLSQETRVMQDANHALTEKLDHSSNELEQLKEELEETRRAASTDILTGIPNRQAFENRLTQLISEQSPFCLLVADIDFFKNFNDSYGHQLGDKVLRFVAQTLQNQLKGQDMVTRFGGEEFAIILPDTPFGGAIAVAENLRKAVQRQRLRRTDNQEYIGNVTLSLGVAMFRNGEKREEIIERADSALYQAKKNGRNCVEPEASTPEKVSELG